jgi:predicted dehydrogenase
MPGVKMEIGECGRDAGIDYLQYIYQYHQVELEDFARSIRTGSRPVIDGREGGRSVRVCDALYACRTQLPEPWVWYRQEQRGVAP